MSGDPPRTHGEVAAPPPSGDREPPARSASTGQFVLDGGSAIPPGWTRASLPLLDDLRAVARAAARGVENDPRVDRHVQRLVLRWVLSWTGRGSVRAEVARRAANEARAVKRLSRPKKRARLDSSRDEPEVLRRVHRSRPEAATGRAVPSRPSKSKDGEGTGRDVPGVLFSVTGRTDRDVP